MQTLKSFLDQSLLIWKDSTPAARFGLVLLLILCVGGVGGVSYWSTQPNYVQLANGLSAREAAEAVNLLASANIKYTQKGAGSIIMVDQRSLSNAYIAIAELNINDGTVVDEKSDIWGSPDQANQIETRNLQRHLAHAIAKSRAISSATVFLNQDPKKPFMRNSLPASASVLLELVPNSQFDESQAVAIAQQVANAVSSLTPDRVAISDTNGNIYSTDDSIQKLSKQEKFRVERENEYRQKALRQLTFLGFNNATVEVTAEYSYEEETRHSTDFSDEKKATTSETIESSSSSSPGGGGGGGGGVAGTPSNVGNANGNNSSDGQITKSDITAIEYQPSETKSVVISNAPQLTGVSASVVVNSIATKDSPEINEEFIKEIVTRAMSVNDAKFEIGVSFTDFPEIPELEPEAFVIPWDQINEIIKNISLGIAALIAFLVARGAFKKLQPDPATTTEVVARDTQVNQLSELVKQNPEVFSKIIASWSNVDSNANTDSDTNTNTNTNNRNINRAA